MDIIKLRERQNISDNIKFSKIYIQLGELLNELRKKELPPSIIEPINQDMEELNASPLTGNALRKLVKQKQTKTIKLLEKELKIVPKNYYRTLWMALGMCFGLAIGVAFGISIGNIALLGIGLPIGMIMGIAMGSGMDKKASEEGRQLNIEIN